MGTWGTGPFDNDTAADSAGTLDEASPEERVQLIHTVLTRTLSSTDYLGDVDESVAAAALIAAQCPGGGPVETAYGPEQPMPPFPEDVRGLAAETLERVPAAGSELLDLWCDPADAQQWQSMVKRLRDVLDPRRASAEASASEAT
jgi:hypothetical protein